MLLTATVEVAGTPMPVRLRNLSEQGALVEGDRLPSPESDTCFARGDMFRAGRVVWVQGRFAGIAFDEPLKREDVLRHVPASKPRARPQLDFKRPGLACRPLTPYERRMLETWMSVSPLGSVGE